MEEEEDGGGRRWRRIEKMGMMQSKIEILSLRGNDPPPIVNL